MADNYIRSQHAAQEQTAMVLREAGKVFEGKLRDMENHYKIAHGALSGNLVGRHRKDMN